MNSIRLLELRNDMPALLVPSSDARKQLSAFCSDTLDVSVSFHESGFDGPGVPCDEQYARFYALSEDATVHAAYSSIHDDLQELAFTPQQIGEFVSRNRDVLHHIGRSSFFLLKEGEHIFGGIFVPYQSRYFAVRSYLIDSVYVVRAKDNYLFLAPEH